MTLTWYEHDILQLHIGDPDMIWTCNLCNSGATLVTLMWYNSQYSTKATLVTLTRNDHVTLYNCPIGCPGDPVESGYFEAVQGKGCAMKTVDFFFFFFPRISTENSCLKFCAIAQDGQCICCFEGAQGRGYEGLTTQGWCFDQREERRTTNETCKENERW